MSTDKPGNMEPMWPSLVSLAAAASLYIVMPDKLTVSGPSWLLLVVVLGLFIPAEIAHKMGKHIVCKIVSYTSLSLVTASMISSVCLHVLAIVHKSLPPDRLLLSAIILWATNILVFAGWYWRLDAGGPHKRSQRPGHSDGAFYFPQMSFSSEEKDLSSLYSNWSPQFVDYLFLSFNTSTALSPTDVPVLSRWAKVLMMVQSSVSLTIVVLLAARAVNIL